METTVFNNGGSQAVRIPREYRFSTDHVFINKVGPVVMITPVDQLKVAYRQAVGQATPDFMEEGVPCSVDSPRDEI